MTINGLPLHPLVLHAAVILVPLTLVFAALLFVPRIRKSMTILAGATAVVAFIFVVISKETGEDLEELLPESAAIEAHAELAEWIVPLTIATAALLGVLALLELPWPRALVRVRAWIDKRTWVLPALRIAGLILSIASVIDIVFIGDSGAAAVWLNRL